MKQYDEQMKNAYESRHQARAVDLWYVLVPGIKVLVKARTPSKIGASWEGPWTILRLMGLADSTVKVLTDAHKARVVVVANVKPYRGDEPIRVMKQLRIDKDWIGKYVGAGGTKWDSSDSDDGWLSNDG